jgi:hypothetical protein
MQQERHMNLFDLLAADPNIDPALRSFLSCTPVAVRGSERHREVMDAEFSDQRSDERRDQLERGE